MKRCARCGESKDAKAFGAAKQNKDGLQSYCRPCSAEYKRENNAKHEAADPEAFRARRREYVQRYRAKHPERTKASGRRTWLSRKYGITPADWDAMVLAQEGRCAICGRELVTVVVDHDHATGQVRALLDTLCNTGLGNFHDDPARLRAAAAYVEEHTNNADRALG